MVRKKNLHDLTHGVETDLDLAPLLSIMVKLIPVLLLSSAFVHVVIIDTDLPQPIKSRIEENKKDQNPEIELKLSSQTGYEIIVKSPNNKVERVTIPLIDGKHFNFVTLNHELIKIKQRYPSVFEIQLNPDSETSYDTIIRTIDMARKPLRGKHTFQYLKNPETGEVEETDFMFPEVTFANALDG
ncbi:MAG: biopolymer transporter ExbD [Bdellovibrionaceae bacterium]|nr:biopolymer transporter ExbD [Pseudobdellovibrionaceae bacterium]MDW8189798.1 biopolymer transporter ExbD [Pseudobdellovibrionaceae bacterium]